MTLREFFRELRDGIADLWNFLLDVPLAVYGKILGLFVAAVVLWVTVRVVGESLARDWWPCAGCGGSGKYPDDVLPDSLQGHDRLHAGLGKCLD